MVRIRFWCSLVEFLVLISLCITHVYCKLYRFLIYLRIITTILVHHRYAKKGNLSVKSLIASNIASFIVVVSMVFILGATEIKKWIVPSFALSFSSVVPLFFIEAELYSIISIIGFISGSFTFPLDWPICWKQTPISHTFMMILGGFIGELTNYLMKITHC